MLGCSGFTLSGNCEYCQEDILEIIGKSPILLSPIVRVSCSNMIYFSETAHALCIVALKTHCFLTVQGLRQPLSHDICFG